LGDALKQMGLEQQSCFAVIKALAAGRTAAGGEVVDVGRMSVSELIDHIVRTHHAYVRVELPRLQEMAERVARKHSASDARLPEVYIAVTELAADLTAHMDEEEQTFFPLVRRIAQAAAIAAAEEAALESRMAQMEREHHHAGRLFGRVRLLTDGFQAGADACNTHCAMLAGLAEFEADLHLHVHKENNVLFPKVRAYASPR
jgi:regulator of cell morphogenesis and NO signaling